MPNVPAAAGDVNASNWNIVAIGVLLVLIEVATWIRAHSDRLKKG